jgi:hypothetical protein
MAKRFQLREVEKVRGSPVAIDIPALVNEGGQPYASQVLGVSQATISKWLQDNGYIRVVRYEKVSEKNVS